MRAFPGGRETTTILEEDPSLGDFPNIDGYPYLFFDSGSNL